jgi:hypothetical protein
MAAAVCVARVLGKPDSGGMMMLGLILGGPLLASEALAAPHLGLVLQISSLLVLLNSLNGAQIGVLVGFEAFKAHACLDAIRHRTPL